MQKKNRNKGEKTPTKRNQSIISFRYITENICTLNQIKVIHFSVLEKSMIKISCRLPPGPEIFSFQEKDFEVFSVFIFFSLDMISLLTYLHIYIFTCIHIYIYTYAVA